MPLRSHAPCVTGWMTLARTLLLYPRRSSGISDPGIRGPVGFHVLTSLRTVITILVYILDIDIQLELYQTASALLIITHTSTVLEI